MLLYNALTKARALYSLESLQLTQGQLAKLNTFQLRGLRQILHMKTTFVQRSNTNRRVLERATAMTKGKKRVLLFSEELAKSKVKWLRNLLSLPQSAPQQELCRWMDIRRCTTQSDVLADQDSGGQTLHWRRPG